MEITEHKHEDNFTYYQSLVSRNLATHGKDFDKLVHKCGILVEIGNRLLTDGKISGFNILPSQSDMDIRSKEDLIFYSNYSGNITHFSRILTEIEDETSIQKSQIGIGIKGSKTIYGGWKIKDPKNEKVGILDGPEGPIPVVSSVETVITFAPSSHREALAIIDKLYKKTDWDYPDFRATVSLEPILSKIGFQKVSAYLSQINTAQLLILHTNPNIKLGEVVEGIEINPELAYFVAAQSTYQ